MYVLIISYLNDLLFAFFYLVAVSKRCEAVIGYDMARADEAWARKDNTKATGSRKSKHDSRPSPQITLAICSK